MRVCFQLDVVRRGIVHIAYEKVDVADDRRLVREIADVGGHVVVADVGACELDRAFRAVDEAFDEAHELLGGDFFYRSGLAVGEGDVVSALEECAGAGGEDQRRAVIGKTARAELVMEQVLAGEAVGEGEGRTFPVTEAWAEGMI
jgi:hypothetical protein